MSNGHEAIAFNATPSSIKTAGEEEAKTKKLKDDKQETLSKHVEWTGLLYLYVFVFVYVYSKMDTQGTSSKRAEWTDMLVGAAALLENTER